MSKKQVTSGTKAKKTIVNIIIHIFLAILSFIWVLPIFWVVLTSFRGEKGSYVTTFFPKTYTINNYVKLFTDTSILNFPKMFMNTFIIAIFTCIISTIFVLSVSYTMSRMRFNMRKPFMNIAMILGLFPSFMSMIAVYYILMALGLAEGSMIRVALIVVFSAGSGVGFYVAKGFFDTIPKALDEAAIIDGATRWQVFTKITVPMLRNTTRFLIITSLIGGLQMFDIPKLFLMGGPDNATLTTSVFIYNQAFSGSYMYNRAAAASMIMFVIICAASAVLFFLMRDKDEVLLNKQMRRQEREYRKALKEGRKS